MRFLFVAFITCGSCFSYSEAPAISGSTAPAVSSSMDQQRQSLERQRDSFHRQEETLPKRAFEPRFFSAPQADSLEPDCPSLLPAEVEQLIAPAASKQSLQPALVRAVMKQESGFKPCAVSIRGAQGLMQLMPSTAEQFHVSDPFEPKQNVDAGTALLKGLLDKYNGDLRLALAAYNAGSNRVDKVGGVPDSIETQTYVTSILADLGRALLETPGAKPATPEVPQKP